MPETRPVIVWRDPEKVLARLPKDLRQLLRVAMDRLATEPRPRGCKKLTGYADLYRIRVGEWRIIFAIKDAELIILVLEMGK
jgi:mRNA interferase RelE/StbE